MAGADDKKLRVVRRAGRPSEVARYALRYLSCLRSPSRTRRLTHVDIVVSSASAARFNWRYSSGVTRT